MIGKQLGRPLPILLLVLAMAGAAPVPAFAEAPARTVSVSAEGRVEAVPDMATVSLGVVKEARFAGEAMAETSAATARVLERLAEFGIGPRDIQTSRLGLDPVWSHSTDNSRPKITGFTASSMLTVRVRDLSRLGEILDAVVEDGANDFNGLGFSVSDPDPLINKARALAVADARDMAAQLAAGAGVVLGPVQSISEQGGGRPQPLAMEMTAARGVPVAAGEVTLSVHVSMVFAIED